MWVAKGVMLSGKIGVVIAKPMAERLHDNRDRHVRLDVALSCVRLLRPQVKPNGGCKEGNIGIVAHACRGINITSRIFSY
jgi:hypothetical protein